MVPQHVAPFAGARIEMKFPDRRITSLYVAPFAGARIEIKLIGGNKNEFGVAPFAGARIEIRKRVTENPWFLSLPSRERGLKS